MSAPLLLTAQFFTTVARLSQLPADGLPEVAFVGRSNAGKSSAINRICNRNRLAFASRTPGRTQALNYFSVGHAHQPVCAYLVDTPGYGYAAAPGDIKRQWDALAGRYLVGREVLRGVVLMIDIRRLVGERDVDLLRWMPPHAPILVLLTKADKLARMHQQRAADTVRDQIASLGLPNPVSLLLFSSLKGTGIDAARDQIEAWLVEAADTFERPDPAPADRPATVEPAASPTPAATAHPVRTRAEPPEPGPVRRGPVADPAPKSGTKRGARTAAGRKTRSRPPPPPRPTTRSSRRRPGTD